MLIHWPACSKFNSHILHFKKVVYNFKSVLIIEQSFPNLKRSWRNGPLANWAKPGLTFPLECLGWNPGCLPDCNSLLMQTQAGKQVTAQWVGSWQYTWETWTEFLAPGFGLAPVPATAGTWEWTNGRRSQSNSVPVSHFFSASKNKWGNLFLTSCE